MGQDDLQCFDTVGNLVAYLIDRAHASGAKWFEDFVVPDMFAWIQYCVGGHWQEPVRFNR